MEKKTLKASMSLGMVSIEFTIENVKIIYADFKNILIHEFDISNFKIFNDWLIKWFSISIAVKLKNKIILLGFIKPAQLLIFGSKTNSLHSDEK